MILNRQKRVRIHTTPLERFEARVRHALALGGRELTVCFVDDREIARLNKKFRGKAKPTDVLSFPATGNGDSSFPLAHHRNYLGDIAISPETARRNANRDGIALDRELRVLILHGVLHLTGHDHEKDNGEMERKEMRLRRKLGIA
ncbi:MAG: rRNA maturation RNase YbeY [Candidatus Acidiferrales bacterium]